MSNKYYSCNKQWFINGRRLILVMLVNGSIIYDQIFWLFSSFSVDGLHLLGSITSTVGLGSIGMASSFVSAQGLLESLILQVYQASRLSLPRRSFFHSLHFSKIWTFFTGCLRGDHHFWHSYQGAHQLFGCCISLTVHLLIFLFQVCQFI